MSFINIVTTLKNERAQAVSNHEEFIEQIDIMIQSAESMIPKNGNSAEKIPLEKLNIDDVYSVLKLNGTLHLKEICELISVERGEHISTSSISMIISHYLRKFKKKAEIKQVEKSTFCIK